MQHTWDLVYAVHLRKGRRVEIRLVHLERLHRLEPKLVHSVLPPLRTPKPQSQQRPVRGRCIDQVAQVLPPVGSDANVILEDHDDIRGVVSFHDVLQEGDVGEPAPHRLVGHVGAPAVVLFAPVIQAHREILRILPASNSPCRNRRKALELGPRSCALHLHVPPPVTGAIQVDDVHRGLGDGLVQRGISRPLALGQLRLVLCLFVSRRAAPDAFPPEGGVGAVRRSVGLVRVGVAGRGVRVAGAAVRPTALGQTNRSGRGVARVGLLRPSVVLPVSHGSVAGPVPRLDPVLLQPLRPSGHLLVDREELLLLGAPEHEDREQVRPHQPRVHVSYPLGGDVVEQRRDMRPPHHLGPCARVEE
mmetsp:Transcript_88903/g.203322  ORF Transcript_88903/g.203322 Transcript_88903/m.203322 type:complete len:360 (-) Transcript_88903:545-1624(-)